MENTPIARNLTLITGPVCSGKTAIAQGMHVRFADVVFDGEGGDDITGKAIRVALKTGARVVVTSQHADILKRVGFKQRPGRAIRIELAKEIPD